MNDREKAMEELMKNVSSQENVYLTEVAIPGCKPTAVDPNEVK